MEPKETPEERLLRKAREKMPQRTHPWSDFQHQSCGWLNFPLFGVEIGISPYNPNDFVVVAVGGGGSGRNGVPNGIYMTTVSQHDLSKSSATFGHPTEQFIDMDSELPFDVALSSQHPICAITIGSKVHLYKFNDDRTIGLEKLLDFQADFCEINKPCVNFVRFSGNNIITAGAENIIRVWSIDDKGVSKAVIDFETILKDINDIDTCIRANGMLSIASASDDGKLRLWNVNVNGSSNSNSNSSNSSNGDVAATLAPVHIFDVPDDGNTNVRKAGKAIFKAVRWGKCNDQAASRPADQLLFGVQSRLNRGKSYLIVWKLDSTFSSSNSSLSSSNTQHHEILSRVLLFPGTDDKVRSMALTCSPQGPPNVVIVAFGSAGGLVSSVHVNEKTGTSCVVGTDVRHATIVSDIAAVSLLNGDGCLITGSMDKGVVLHTVAGLIEKTTAVRRKRCCVNMIVLFFLGLLSGVSLWYFNIVNEDMVMQWKSDVELMLSDVDIKSNEQWKS